MLQNLHQCESFQEVLSGANIHRKGLHPHGAAKTRGVPVLNQVTLHDAVWGGKRLPGKVAPGCQPGERK